MTPDGATGSVLQRCIDDQRRRWSEGKPLTIEAYLTRYPPLAANPESVLDLVYNEYCLRDELGQQPQPAEYLERFPTLATELQSLFHVDAELAPGLAKTQEKPLEMTTPSAAEARDKRASDATTLEQFVENLLDSGLIPSHEVAALRADLLRAGHAANAETLARKLVKAGKLTKYQAQAVYQGKTKGLVFGEYRVLEKLGQGGMGVVLKAEHRRMKRLVAVKMLADAALRSPDAVKRFYREVEAAAKLNHPNIVQAHDASEHEGVNYLVMEYVDGKDLAAIVKDEGPLPVTQAVDYIIQTARGLQYAHEQGIVHRDIKPANLLVDNKGTVKILDMGLARVGGLVDESNAHRLTASGQVMGTLDYMAPEQALDTHQADARADIYSLGCTFHWLLTGDVLFGRETLAKILIAHQMCPVPSLCQTRSDVPPQLDAVFQKMVAKKPEDRQQSMTEVIDALKGCLGRGSAVATDRDSPPGSNSQIALQDNLAFLTTTQGNMLATAEPFVVGLDETVPNRATATNLRPGQGEQVDQSGSPSNAKSPPDKHRRLLVAAGTGGVALVLVVFAVLIVIHRNGKQTEIEVPDRSTVKINAEGKVQVTLAESKVDGKSPVSKSQEPGKSRKPDAKNAGAISPHPQARRGEADETAKTLSFVGPHGNWKLSPDAPPPAIAPFDAKKAGAHQAAWAKYLHVPVETTNSIGMEFALIPPGEFEMGSTPEEIAWASEEGKKHNEYPWYFQRVSTEGPRHRIRITAPFYLAMYPVTQGQYEKVIGVNPSAFTAKQMGVSAFKPPLSESDVSFRHNVNKAVAGRDTSRHPVESVTWDEAMEFCRKLSATSEEKAAKRGYRLPTEAQWEYACRAGTTTRWYSGDDEAGLPECGWFVRNARSQTHPVGTKYPNAWGLYDMHGNVWQWCADYFSLNYYQQSPSIDPCCTSVDPCRVLRGGAWNYPAAYCRAAHRYSFTPSVRHSECGFRAVYEIAAPAGCSPGCYFPTDAGQTFDRSFTYSVEAAGRAGG